MDVAGRIRAQVQFKEDGCQIGCITLDVEPAAFER
jgi:hypothetical protein